VYGNGVLIDFRSNNTGNPGTGTNVALGGSWWRRNNNNQLFQGAIEDFRLYNRILNADEVQIIHACEGEDYITDGLVRWWPMNDLMDGTTVTAVTEMTAVQSGVVVNSNPTYEEGIIA